LINSLKGTAGSANLKDSLETRKVENPMAKPVLSKAMEEDVVGALSNERFVSGENVSNSERSLRSTAVSTA